MKSVNRSATGKARDSDKGKSKGRGRDRFAAGEDTVWGGLFFEIVRGLTLGPSSMQPRLLKAFGDDYVNTQDDIRFGARLFVVVFRACEETPCPNPRRYAT